MSLPLRLKVEVPVRSVCGLCFVLPSADETKVCFIVNDYGLIALACCGHMTSDEITTITKISSADLPDYSLCQVGENDGFQWWKNGARCARTPVKSDITSAAKCLHSSVARVVLESIERYYSRQVLEPSIRGFLAILEKQFPRNDLYLFELLQNAVDDGANTISMTSLKVAGAIGEGPPSGGIHFCHNGRGFTPLDVLGLASVGLSTKGSSSDEKRKIGFMGVGFKAVYKRFAKVTVFDHVWKFCFAEPATTPPMEPTHSWVLKPSWDVSASKQLCDEVPDSDSWCHFVLEKPRGGSASVRADMSSLPETCPVLLGRQALKVRRADVGLSAARAGDLPSVPWRLRWEDREFLVQNATDDGTAAAIKPITTSSCLFSRVGAVDDLSVQSTNSAAGTWTFCYGDTVRVGVRGGSAGVGEQAQHWQFLTVCFHPSISAKQAYEAHTKRPWRGDRAETLVCGGGACSRSKVQSEEISMFFRVTEANCPIIAPGRPKGLVHAVLPTKLTLPCSMHIQASWLLSVDRQDVQSLSDNSWNNCLYAQVPRLLVGLLKWIATVGFQDLEPPYRLLPPLHFMTPGAAAGSATTTQSSAASAGAKLCFTAFDQVLDVQELCDSLRREAVVPVWRPMPSSAVSGASTAFTIPAEACNLEFVTGDNAIWLPPILVRTVPYAVLQQWFGQLPFASDRLKDCAWHNLWASSLRRPTASLLAARKSFFVLPPCVRKSVVAKVYLAIVYLAAMYECMTTLPPSEKGGAAGTQGGDRRQAKFQNSGAGASASAASESLCGDMLPPFQHWPVFVTSCGEYAATAAEVVYLEPMLFTRDVLSDELYGLLRTVAGRALTPLASSGSSQGSQGGGGFRGSGYHHQQKHQQKHQRQRHEAPVVVPVQLLDEDLEQVLSNGVWPEAPADVAAGPLSSESERLALLTSARKCVDFARSSNPGRVVSVEHASAVLLSQWAADSRGRPLDATKVTVVVKLFVFAMKHKLAGAISHVLVDAATVPQRAGPAATGFLLLPVASTYTSKASSHANLPELLKMQTLWSLSGRDGAISGAAAASSSAAAAAAGTSTGRAESSSSLPYVATAYVTHPANGSKLTERYLNTYNCFLLLCGAQKGISLVATCRKPFPAEIDRLPDGQLPKLRQTATSSNFVLPFNLGTLTKKKVEVVDVDMSPEWVTILRGASSSKTLTSGHDNAALILMLLRSADLAEAVTADTTPYLAALIKPPPSASGAAAAEPAPIPSDADHRLPYDVDQYPPPGFARMLYLPPGQAGASVVSLAPAQWVCKLAELKWVPAAAPGAAPSDPASVFLTPAEVVLDVSASPLASTTSSGGGQAGSVSISDLMPTVRLPPAALELLKGLPVAVQKLFAWGTVKPPPPIDRLKVLAADIAEMQQQSQPDAIDQGGGAVCSKEVCRQLCGLWRNICLAYRERRLTTVDVQVLRNLCSKPLSGEASAKPVCLFPMPMLSQRDECVLVPLDRCVFIPPNGTSAFADETHAAVALAQVGFLLNIGAGSFDARDASSGGALEEVLRVYGSCGEELRSILALPTKATKDVSIEYLNFVSSSVQAQAQRARSPARSSASRGGNVHHPSLAEKKAYSLALWTVARSFLVRLGGGDSRSPSESAVAAAGKQLKHYLPNLHIYCRKGPGDSILTFPATWRPVWGAAAGDDSDSSPVTPLLMDEGNIKAAGSGISMVNLLTHKHNFQPIGILDFGDGSNRWQGGWADGSGSLLAAADNILVSILGIPRLSDRKFFSLKAKAVGKGELQAGLGQRLEAVELLVRLLAPQPGSGFAAGGGRAESPASAPARPCPEIYRHSSLEVIFRTPVYDGGAMTGHTDTPISVFAMRGPFTTKPPKDGGAAASSSADGAPATPAPAATGTRVQSLLISGESDDYAAELEEMLLAHYWNIGHGSAFGNSGNSSRIRKALLLIQHLEDEQKFLRMFSRYFAEFASDPVPGQAEGAPAGSSHKRKARESGEEPDLPPHAAEGGDVDVGSGSDSEADIRDDDGLSSADAEEVARRQSLALLIGAMRAEREAAAAREQVVRGAKRAREEVVVGRVSEENPATAPTVPAAGGAGRGVSILPSWMTASEATESHKHTAAISSAAAPDPLPMSVETAADAGAFLASMAEHIQHLKPPANPAPAPVADAPATGVAGAGRGVSMLPAWMTAPNTDSADAAPPAGAAQVAQASSAAPTAATNFQGEGSVSPAAKKAKMEPAAGGGIYGPGPSSTANGLRMEARGEAGGGIYGPGTGVSSVAEVSPVDTVKLAGMQPVLLLLVHFFRSASGSQSSTADTHAWALVDALSACLGGGTDGAVRNPEDLTAALRGSIRVLIEEVKKRQKSAKSIDPAFSAICRALEK